MTSVQEQNLHNHQMHLAGKVCFHHYLPSILSNQEHNPQQELQYPSTHHSVPQKAFELERYHDYFPVANLPFLLSQAV
jgi:hypothetical protein